jgi:hypothetical protein
MSTTSAQLTCREATSDVAFKNDVFETERCLCKFFYSVQKKKAKYKIVHPICTK